jgi:iron(III) transport system substrate-binding protein
VVVYSALDREFAEPVLKAYEKQTGVTVASKFDIESTKTVGLVNLILAESARPRCDLFWNNEIPNTARMHEGEGVARFVLAHACRRIGRDVQG